jgi:hypothetical protein
MLHRARHGPARGERFSHGIVHEITKAWFRRSYPWLAMIVTQRSNRADLHRRGCAPADTKLAAAGEQRRLRAPKTGFGARGCDAARKLAMIDGRMSPRGPLLAKKFAGMHGWQASLREPSGH